MLEWGSEKRDCRSGSLGSVYMGCGVEVIDEDSDGRLWMDGWMDGCIDQV
jgi:hypothetical protein